MCKDIILFIPSLGGGGAEHFTVNLANELVEKKVNVKLVVGNAKGPNLKRLSDRVQLTDLKCERVYRTLPKLVKFIKQNKHDVLFSTLDHANIVALMAHIISKKNSKVIIRQATILQNKIKSFKSYFLNKILMLLSKRADAVITTSKMMYDEFLYHSNINANKIFIIPNPVEINKVQEKLKAPLNCNWLTENNLPIVIAVGRLEAVKGFDKLLMAFYELKKRMPAKLIILGEGSLRSDLETQVEELGLIESVLMPGFVDNIYPFIHKADLFALTSSYEGFPNGMLEAMACNTHIVAFNCPGGVNEILQDGKWGKLVPLNDTDSLCKAMFDILNKNSNLPEVNIRANDFSMEKIINKYLDLFFN